VYVPLDPQYPPERLAHIIENADTSVLIIQSKFKDRIPHYRGQVIWLETLREQMPDPVEAAPSNEVTSDRVAYAIYTSGSTSAPKGVLGLHRSTVNRLNWMWVTHPFSQGEICCAKTSAGFVDSISELLGPLLQGIPIVILRDEVVKDIQELVTALAVSRVSRIILVPSLLRMILLAGRDLSRELPELKYWVSSGEALSLELIDQFNRVLPGRLLLNLYGSSEVAGDVTWLGLTESHRRADASVGRPIFNTSAYLLGRYLEPVPVGVPGEICVGGENLARGYLKQPGLTAEKFIPDPFGEMGERLYKTGDLGRYAVDGDIEYLGRLDRQVKIRGHRVEPGEIEAVLSKHPAVEQCAIYFGQNEFKDPRLVACIVPRNQMRPTSTELLGYLRKILPAQMVPSAFVQLDELPMTPTGKVDRSALLNHQGDYLTTGLPYVSPQTSIEHTITQLWQEVLGIEKIGTQDNFFDLGGHSLLLVQVHEKVRQTLDDGLTLMELFEYPTIASLSARLSRSRREEPAFEQSYARAELRRERISARGR
jgi:amino acid adenylation domain-containing protein